MKKTLIINLILILILLNSCVSSPEPVEKVEAKAPQELSLIELIEQGNKEGLKELFKGRIQINNPDIDGRYPVHLATAKRAAEMLELLLAMGANPNSQDTDGKTALHYAVDIEDVNLAKILLKNGASIFIKNKAGISPFDAAIAKDFSYALIDSNSIKSRGPNGETPLHIAVDRLSLNAVKKILEFNPDINLLDNDGRTALDQAFLHPNTKQAAVIAELLVTLNAVSTMDVFSYFIKAVKNTNYSNARYENGTSVLHEAVRNKHLGFLAFFLDRNVPVDIKTSYGSTALHEAVKQSSLEAAKLLLEAGANPDIKDGEGRSSLHNAFFVSSDMVELLLSSQANPSLKDNYGNSALHLAVSLAYSAPLVSKIIKKGIALDATNSDGDSALIIATKQKNIKLIELLASMGASKFIKNRRGESPMSLSLMDGEESTKTIIKASPLDIRDEAGEGPFHYAVRNKAGASIITVLKDLNLDVSDRNNIGESALHLACKLNSPIEGKALLIAGADPYIADAEGRSPISLAINADPDTLAWFFSTAVLSSSDSSGNNPLHYAAMNANVAGVQYLVKAGIGVDSRNKDGQTPLMLSTKKNSPETISALLILGANPRLRDNSGFSILHLSVYWQAKECLTLLSQSGIDIDIRDYTGKTALRHAVDKADPFTVAFFLEKGAKPIAEDNFGVSPLHAAAKLDDEHILKALLTKTDELDIRNNYGTSPLLEAVYANKIKTAKTLIEHGASIYTVDASGDNPLSYVAKKNPDFLEYLLSNNYKKPDEKPILQVLIDSKVSTEVIKKALDTKIPVNDRDSFGRTALYYAVESKRSDLIELLLNYGAERFLMDYQGRSPLSLAFSAGYNMIASLFGTDPDAADYLGETALHYAASFGQEKAVEALLALGADPSKKNVAGERASDIAKRKAYLSIVKLLGE